jgi:hypothetical protein
VPREEHRTTLLSYLHAAPLQSIMVALRRQVANLDRRLHASRPPPPQPTSELPSAEQTRRTDATFNSQIYEDWLREDVLLAAVLLPRVVEQLDGFTAAIAAGEEAANGSYCVAAARDRCAAASNVPCHPLHDLTWHGLVGLSRIGARIVSQARVMFQVARGGGGCGA